MQYRADCDCTDAAVAAADDDATLSAAPSAQPEAQRANTRDHGRLSVELPR